MKRQLAAIVTALSMLVPSAAVFAEETNSDTAIELADTELEIAAVSGTCGDNLTWELSNDGTLTISGSGDMWNWTSSSRSPWYGSGSKITTVKINNGVTGIGDWAFYSCGSLSSISLPKGLTSIGDYAFMYCSRLSSISLPEGLTSIGDYAFIYCSRLSSISLPKGLADIDGSAFNHCSNLSSITVDESNQNYTSQNGVLFNKAMTEIVRYPEGKTGNTYSIPNSVTVIGDSAFRLCGSLSSISLPEGLTSIGDDAFNWCSSLSSISIPEGVTSIGGHAFYYCRSLSSISLPEGLTSIGDSAFYRCNSLSRISLPEGLTSIGDSAFMSCSSLSSISLSEGLTSIGDSAFSSCSNLSNISLPEGVTSIGDSAFRSCSSLSSISLPESLTGIGNYAFSSCESLSSISLPEGLTSIGDYAFAGCDISSISIPEGVTSIGDSAFRLCDSLSSISLPDSLISIGDSAFSYCDSLSSISLPKGLADIDGSAFMGCTSLINITVDESNQLYTSQNGVLFNKAMTEIVRYPEGKTGNTYSIPNSVTVIGDSAFRLCDSLSSISIPEGVTGIGDYAFSDCDSLSSINMPEGLTSIGDSAFASCFSLSNISLPEGVTSIGDFVFRDCDSLSSISLPEGLTSIGDSAFSSCSNLSNISLPEGVTSIGDSAFRSCSSLSSISLPESLTGIGNYAFSSCESLSSISLPEGLTSIGDYTFSSCNSLADIYYGGTEEEWNAIVIGLGSTPLTSAEIHYGWKTAKPVIEISGGNEIKTISITCATDESEIYYTLDGSTPTSESERYTAPINVEKQGVYTIKAIAVKTNYYNSDIVSEEFSLIRDTSGVTGSITWNYENGLLRISGQESMLDYNAGEAPWYGWRDEIKEVVIESGVKSIGNNAFYGLVKLEKVSIPESVLQINDNAFSGCESLQAVELPNTMSGGIGAGAFLNCASITQIQIPENVVSIGAGAFEGCQSLIEITLPFIGSQNGNNDSTNTFAYVFNGNVPTTLKKVTITNDSMVPQNAFSGLSSIEEITVNDEIQSIGTGAFDGCAGLKSFSIPNGVTSIGDNTFRGCENAETITVPDTVTSIGESSFDGCKKLKEINIPDGVKYLYNNTFRNCSSLTRIEIPVTVTGIGESVLVGCTSLIEVKVPFVGANADPGAKEETLQGIFGYLFGCADNKDIPASVTKVEVTGTDRSNYIPKGAFRNCGNIMDIIIDGGRNILDGAFVNCRYLTNLYIPGSISSIGVNEPILEGCSNLETLTIPFIGGDRSDVNSETSVLGALFGYDDEDITGTKQYYNSEGEYHYYKIPRSLKNVSLLNQENIPDRAFMECDFIEKIAVVTGANMGERAFYHCASLKRAALPDDLRNIGEQSFAGCESLETINIPSKVKSIGESAFYNARSLKNVTMPDSITEIAEDIFNGTNLLSDEEINVMASNKGVITCSLGSAAYNYAVSNGIQTNVVDSSELTVKRTSTTVSLLSDGSYMFDVVNTCNMRGILNIELYNENTELISSKTRETGDDIEYRVQFTGIEMAGVEYARIYITDETGEAVSTEDELISVSGGEIPDIGESDLEMTYRNGEIVFSGTAYIRPGTVLIQAVYNEDGSLDRMNTYDVKDISEPISVENIQGSKFMLWSGMDNMRPLAGIIKAE